MAGTLLFNPTPRDITGGYGGREYTIKANSRLRVKSVRANADQVYHAEEIAEKLHADHRREGLFLIDEDAPLTTEQYRAMGRKALAGLIRGVVLEFNVLNQTQASINKPILFPSDGMRELQAMLPQLDSGKADFIGQDELDKIASRAEANAFGQMVRIIAAVESGDMEAVRAAIPQSMFESLARQGKAAIDKARAGAVDVAEKPGPELDDEEEVPELNPPIPQEDMPRPPADLIPDPVTPGTDRMETEFVTPTTQLGKGPGNVPHAARTLGGQPARGPKPRR